MLNRTRLLGAAVVLAAASACDKAPTAPASPPDERSAILTRYPTIAEPNLLALLGKGVPSTGVSAGLIVPGEGAIIDNGTIQLGVRELGDLNVAGGTPSAGQGNSRVGLRLMSTNNEATADGCTCEGWGVADAASPTFTGYANSAVGTAGLTLVSFTATGSTAKSVVTAGDGSKMVRVTHDFAPAAETRNLYRVVVTIENIGTAAISDLRYTRTFDWDVEPTQFNEYVTIQGAAAATNLAAFSNNGFETSDPLGFRSGGTAPAGDFVDFGPRDQGTNFDFKFGSLDAGKKMSFTIYYGGAATETGALNALKAVGAEVYSLGQPNVPGADPPSQISGRPNTFAFGFKGVGGEAINNPPVATLGAPATGKVGDAIAFTTAASDPDGDAVTCTIDFGDGSGPVSLASCGAGATRTYTVAGTYTVTLTARDIFGALGTATKTVTIGGGGPPPACSPNTAPTLELVGAFDRIAVEATAKGIPVAEMLRFRFGDPDCGPWVVQIAWGDDHTSNLPISTALGPGLYNTYHAYEAEGTYTIRAKVVDSEGLASPEQTITMIAVFPRGDAEHGIP